MVPQKPPRSKTELVVSRFRKQVFPKDSLNISLLPAASSFHLLLFFMARKKSLCEMQPCSVSSTRSLSRTIVCAVVGRAKPWPCSGFMFVILSEQQGFFNTRISRSGMSQVGKFLVFPNIKHFIYMKRVWNETFSAPHASSWKTKCGMCQGPKLEE